MAVPTTDAFSGPYITNGATIAFPFTFKAPSTSEVSVLLRDADGAELTPPAFSVALGVDAGGTVTFVSAPAAGNTLLVLLDPFFTQDLEFENGSAWLAEPVNEGYDRSALRDQVLLRDVRRGILAPLGEPGFQLPAVNARKGKYLGFSPVDGGLVPADSTDGDGILRPDLASNDTDKGSGLIGFSHSADYPIGSLGWKDQTYVSPYDHPFNATGGADDTQAVQEAIDHCVANYPHVVLDWSGEFRVSKIVMQGGNGFLAVGVCKLTANSTAPQSSLLDIRMPGVTIDGAVKIDCGYRTNYECGMWLHATALATVQFSFPADIVINGAVIGFRIGDKAFPSALTSEISFTGISTYGCPICVEVIGAETYVTIDSPQLSADAFGGDAAWQALPKRVARCIGADLVMTGGSAPLTSASNDAAFELQPIQRIFNGNPDCFYGSMRLIGVTVESASPYLKVSNPDGLTINSQNKRRGLFAMIGCRGYHGNNGAASVTTTADFQGDIILRDNRMWCPVARSYQNVVAGSLDTHVYLDGMGMGDGFRLPLSGVSGGTVHYGWRTILQRQDPQGQVLTVGANTIKFQVSNGFDCGRADANYSTATGAYTTEQAFGNLRVTAQIAFSAPATGTLIIVDNGTGVRSVSFNSATEVSASWITANYGALRGLSVLVNLTGAGATVSAAGFLSTFTVEARN